MITEIPWSSQLGYPILSLLQLLPLAAVALVWLLRRQRLAVHAGIAMAGLELLLCIDLWRHYDPARDDMQFCESLRISDLLHYHAGIDGVSLLFILLTGLLTLLLALYGVVRELKPFSRLYMAIFTVQASLMGQFVTLNLLWFVLLSALQLGLIGYLLWRWGISPEKDVALRRFYQFMGVALLLLLAGTGLLGWNHADILDGQWSFDLVELTRTPVDERLHSLAFFLLFYGLAIRTPIFPLHGWLPMIAERGNVAVAPTLMLGLKIGIFGLLRFVLPLLPSAVVEWHAYVAAFALVGIFYAAFLAMMQQNLRRLLAYTVISHSSLLILGIFSLDHNAFMGSVILSVTLGLALTTLFFITGLLYRRTQTTLLSNLGGLFDTLPFFGITFLVGGLSIIGMPGTPGFNALHLMMEAAIDRFGALVTIASALGNVVTAGFLLWAFQRAFLAPRASGLHPIQVIPVSRAERFVIGALVLVLLWAGFYIEPWLTLIDKPLAVLSALFEAP